MAERFRKSIKLAPGVRMVRRRSGSAWRPGQKLATVGIGKVCPVLAAGKSALQAKPLAVVQLQPGAAGVRQIIAIQIAAEVDDQGLICLRNGAGSPLSDALTERLKMLRAEEIRILMQRICDAINRQIESLGEIHIYTPPPDAAPKFESERFTTPRPTPPILQPIGFLGWLFRSVGLRIVQHNAQATLQYEAALVQWETAKATREAQQAEALDIFERVRGGDIHAMERLLEMKLASIVWPCELLVSLSISEDGTQVMMDVSLPALEDMPTNFAILPTKGLQLGVVEIPQSQVRYLYMRLAHAIGFRLLGEVFTNLQSVKDVVLSAYIPHTNETTGETVDQFSYSVAVHRPEWRKVGFNKIRGIDVVSVFSMFALRRGIPKAGVFKPIEPFDRFPDPMAVEPSPEAQEYDEEEDDE